MNATTATSTHPTRGLPRALPFEPLELLAGRSRRLADLVESVSRRRDVRELRARLLVLLLELRCPPQGRPRRPWYVPGAVARLGVEGLRRAWRGFFGLEPPCPRTLRSHLGVLERVLALGRQPGDWVAVEDATEGAWRPRHADTLHVLDSEELASAWAGGVAPLVRARPALRRNPDAWRRAVGAWRRRAPRQLDLFEAVGRPEGLPDRVGEDRPSGEALARAVGELEREGAADALDLLRVAQGHGVRVHGRASFELAADRRRLAGVLALLARALARGDAVRNRAAWCLRAHRFAGRDELGRALAWAVGYGGGGP